jgi:hypothetical protein
MNRSDPRGLLALMLGDAVTGPGDRSIRILLKAVVRVSGQRQPPGRLLTTEPAARDNPSSLAKARQAADGPARVARRMPVAEISQDAAHAPARGPLLTHSQARSLAESLWGPRGTTAYRTNRTGAFYFSCSGHGGFVIDDRALTERERALLTESGFKADRCWGVRDASGRIVTIRHPDSQVTRPRKVTYRPGLGEHVDQGIPVWTLEEDCEWAAAYALTAIRTPGRFSAPEAEIIAYAKESLGRWYPKAAEVAARISRDDPEQAPAPRPLSAIRAGAGQLGTEIDEIVERWDATEDVDRGFGVDIEEAGRSLQFLAAEVAGAIARADPAAERGLHQLAATLGESVGYYAGLGEHDTNASIDIFDHLGSGIAEVQRAIQALEDRHSPAAQASTATQARQGTGAAGNATREPGAPATPRQPQAGSGRRLPRKSPRSDGSRSPRL